MAILLREGFGNLSDGTHTAGSTREILGEQWVSYGGNFALEDRADGRKWIKNTGSVTAPRIRSNAFAENTTIAIAFRIYRTDTSAINIVALYDSGGLLGCIGINASSQLVYSVDSSGRILYGITSTGPMVPQNTETFVEARIVFHGAAGSVTWYVNGVQAAQTTGIDTINAGTGCDNVYFVPSLAGGWGEVQGLPNGWKFADLLVHTDASPIGDVGVYYKPVTGDIGTPDFTPSAGSDNYAMLDEIGPDEDTTYNESDGTAGHRDQFSAAGLAGMTILEVCTLVRARKTSTGTATLLLGMEEGATEDQSAAKALSEDYLTLIAGWVENPDTSAAWSTGEAADALISYEVGA